MGVMTLELKIICIFCLILLSCILLELPLLLALALGLALFLGYGHHRGIGLGRLFKWCWEGILTVRNILITFLLIGMLTASWRACGTIPVIVTLASSCISPSSFILMAFLLNALISFLIGTSFGTVATMGVICISIAQALQVNYFWVVGAIISGIYFGDRCSPVSTSALLVSTLTETDIYHNIRLMLRSCAVPALLSCALYYYLGTSVVVQQQVVDIRGVFADSFTLSNYCILPAVAILSLALLRVNVKLTMAVSIVIACAVGLLVEGITPLSMGRSLLLGYTSADPSLARMLNGGGIISMVRVFSIVCMASCYAGIFKGTGLLEGLQEQIAALSTKIGRLGTLIIASVVTSMLACNQTLAIMLTHQLCHRLEEPQQLALNLEDTVVVISPLVPWNIAVAVPLATLGAEPICILGACYLYLLPLWRLVRGQGFKFC